MKLVIVCYHLHLSSPPPHRDMGIQGAGGSFSHRSHSHTLTTGTENILGYATLRGIGFRHSKQHLTFICLISL